jgi:aryl-alcohol dehydrogenase-like predicted oxidoreductase
MEHRRLGRTDATVSAICLGTMTWGLQNTEAEGHAQMDYAFDRGVTFFDTAEMYAAPPSAETYGRTEQIIGSWFQATGRRDRVFLASKVSGPAPVPWVRGGQNRLDRANIQAAVDASLRRLRTDYIDLYQVHWPQRPLALFGRRAPEGLYTDGGVPIEETLAALAELVTAGKVRHIGVSNETAWGVMAYLRAAEARGLPPIASIQNVYNLLSRVFDTDLAEVAMREQVGLLGYSPLAGGTLSGKYLNGAVPAGTRRSIDTRGSRYGGPVVDPIVERYLDIAKRYGLNPTQMAIAFALRQPFMTSVIIGATSMANLESNIAGADVTLSDALVDEIEAVHQSNPSPCP